VTTRPVTRQDITGLWTGLRPLLAPVDGKHAPSERTADLSRRHTVSNSTPGLVSITGGKLTTYRKMAQDTVDAALKDLGRRAVPCITKALRLRGAGQAGHAPARSAAAADDHRGPPPDQAAAVAAHLAGRYGTETPAVLSMADGRPDLLEPLVPGLHYLGAEAVYAVREEMAGTLADVLDRRTRASLRDARGTAAAATRVASLIGPELGWAPDRIAAEAEAYAGALRATLARAGLEPEVPDGSTVASAAPAAEGR
jgi:glycerol-3-phosphate dehydrogenase